MDHPLDKLLLMEMETPLFKEPHNPLLTLQVLVAPAPHQVDQVVQALQTTELHKQWQLMVKDPHQHKVVMTELL